MTKPLSAIAIGIFSLFLMGTAQASTEVPCEDFTTRHGLLNIYRFPTQSGKCFLSVSPYRGPGYNYRSFLFTNEGMLMVFVSLLENGVDKTGSRVFHFFPRPTNPGMKDLGDDVQIRLADPTKYFVVNKANGYLQSFSHGQVTEDTNLSSTNSGGVEIAPRGVLMLDSGWMFGGDPTSNLSRRSIFYDGHGQNCRITNREVFEIYEGDNVRFKLSDKELKTFLAQKCPRLRLNF